MQSERERGCRHENESGSGMSFGTYTVCISSLPLFLLPHMNLVIYALCSSNHVACIMKREGRKYGQNKEQEENITTGDMSGKSFPFLLSFDSVNCDSKTKCRLLRGREDRHHEAEGDAMKEISKKRERESAETQFMLPSRRQGDDKQESSLIL